MDIKLEVPKYDSSVGFKYTWIPEFVIKVSHVNNTLSIEANKAGLTSLAINLLNLAQDDVPLNHHIHLDEYNSLENGSIDLIIEKTT